MTAPTFKPGVTQNIALHASPVTGNNTTFLMCAFSLHSPSFLPSNFTIIIVIRVMTCESDYHPVIWSTVSQWNPLCSTVSMFHRVSVPPCPCSTMSMFHHVYVHRVYVPPCLCSTTDRKILGSIVSLVHRVYVPPCLCSTTDRRILGSIVSLVHRVYVYGEGLLKPQVRCATSPLYHHYLFIQGQN